MTRTTSAVLALIISVFSCSLLAQTGPCTSPDQIDSTMVCPLSIVPVCGCDGVTYDGPCEAEYYGGVNFWTTGECGNPLECVDLGSIGFGLCSMVLGVALINGSCTYLSGCGWVVGGTDYSMYSFDTMADCASCEDALGPGCTYPLACNYNPISTEDDGSCVFPPFGCDLPFSGCTYENALNFWWQALYDDGSCIFETCSPCVGDLNGDDFVGVSDVLLLLGSFGNPCPVE